MTHKSRFTQFVFAIIVATCMIGSPPLAAENRAPAGQMCPTGSYVIGFDPEGNIICSEARGNAVLDPDETGDDGSSEIADSCPAACQPERVDTKGADEEIVAEVIPAKSIPADPVIIPSIPDLTISDVEPPWVVFGTPELAITVSGTGFHAGSVIIFEGSTYTPSVNQAGTQLNATIPTGKLSIGPYPIKVSNGSGMEATLRKALEIY